jgi:hypothetical protein
MAGNPRYRLPFATDRRLLDLASSVILLPAPDRAVFYAEDDGARLAAQFVAAHPEHTRLDELLQRTPSGAELWLDLTARNRPWASTEEVWWELSWRLARAAKGVVNVFGPARLVADRPLTDYRHKYSTGSYAHTVFEKVELPELEANPHVTRIFYNGRPFE